MRLFGIDLDSLYPNPLGSHGKTIQSRVNCDSPDLETFPNFSNARCQYCVLEPGEMLFIPAFVWHQVLPARNNHMAWLLSSLLSRWQLLTQESRSICFTEIREKMSLFRKCSESLTDNISSIGSWTSLNKTESSRVFRRSSPGYLRSADISSSNSGMRFPQRIR